MTIGFINRQVAPAAGHHALLCNSGTARSPRRLPRKAHSQETLLTQLDLPRETESTLQSPNTDGGKTDDLTVVLYRTLYRADGGHQSALSTCDF